MPPPSRTPIVLSVASLAVRFTWAGDRWAHEVTRPGEGSIWRSVEASVDDGGDPRWPQSPAFVDVTRLGTGDGAPVMAVGLAGRTHFSAVILADPAVSDAIRFDVAARLQDEPVRLGSAYRPLGPGAGATILRVEPGGGTTGTAPRTARWCYRVSSGGIEALEGATLVPPRGGAGRSAPPA